MLEIDVYAHPRTPPAGKRRIDRLPGLRRQRHCIFEAAEAAAIAEDDDAHRAGTPGDAVAMLELAST